MTKCFAARVYPKIPHSCRSHLQRRSSFKKPARRWGQTRSTSALSHRQTSAKEQRRILGRKERLLGTFRDAENLHLDRTVAGTVELGETDGLPITQGEFAVAHRDRKRVAQHHRAQMRIGVLAIALGEFRIVVPPVIDAAD